MQSPTLGSRFVNPVKPAMPELTEDERARAVAAYCAHLNAPGLQPADRLPPDPADPSLFDAPVLDAVARSSGAAAACVAHIRRRRDRKAALALLRALQQQAATSMT
ncbi:hypothetical protein CKO11_05290 [Rhodobacter sp. TJ_12]|uniref:hypothetical protein n=1 Tax=Rhodobacter sp. TJ_12 TaxID=2029399 RepID=UPI001CBB0EC9|nr:hypothetical protein [Rhodobacter sp. TJ_12]MBZ4021872.1 hypothetical protein [Rhodobacter sp. TJ_12]